MPKQSDRQVDKQDFLNRSNSEQPPSKGPTNPGDSGDNGKLPLEPNQAQMFMSAISWLLVISSVIYLWSGISEPPRLTISYSAFKEQLRSDNIEKVLIKESGITGIFRVPANAQEKSDQAQKKFKTLIPSFGDTTLLTLLEKNQVEIESINGNTPVWISIIFSIAPWFVLVAFLIYSSKMLKSSMGGGIGGFGKSKAKHHEAANIQTRYADVAGLDGAKADLQEIIDYLKNPEIFREIGARMPKGILMMGAPGCGKTLLARATAGEAGVPFFSVSGSEFIEMYVGVGASRVRDMFNDARKQAPALIFIDEIDSVGRVRGTGMGGGNDEREQTLNQILAEMDGFSPDEAVVVLAATNRPDVLDPALLRPGRFDRKLTLELPSRKAREDIILVHTRKVPLAEDVDVSAVAAETVGFSGADIANLVNEAALRAAREKAKIVTANHFSEARDKIVMGGALGEILGAGEKERVAFHEAGHALTAFYSPHSDPVNKVSIIPRGRSLGMTEQLPTEDRHNYTQHYLEERVCILLGGRAAEKIKFEEVSSGAADDLKQATRLARQMITQWGMSDRIGAVNLQQGEDHPFLGREIAEPKKFSEYSAQIVDEEISKLVARCEDVALQRLHSHSLALSALANALLERESLNHDDIDQLLSAF
ncbi:MAG: cell division protease FtsH [Gammaproteobacteria bacterium]|jgi:cell division protease FtsH